VIAKWVQWPRIQKRPTHKLSGLMYMIKQDEDGGCNKHYSEERFPARKFEEQSIRRARKLEHKLACAIGNYQMYDKKA
jgi:hypothetical protein